MIAEQEIDNVLNGLEDAFQILGYHEGMAVLERRIVDKALKEPKIARFLKDMEKYDKPRLQGSPASPHNIERRRDDSLNYFAPKRNLQAMLTQEWFDRMCIDKKRYAREWRETFVSNLMASEHGEYIARKWADHKQILMIRAHVVGALEAAGVLKGSYDSIAARIGLTDDPRSFSRYMSQGKKQPFAEWVSDYVSEPMKE